MKESIKMEDYDGLPWKSTRIERTRIVPLRLISNWLGGIASDHLLKGVFLDEEGNYGWRYKYHAKMWKYLNKPYEKWGTYYRLDTSWLEGLQLDMMGSAWDDYDSDGFAYWEYSWQEDPVTGDAWRIIKPDLQG
jgi:hypothetical protein